MCWLEGFFGIETSHIHFSEAGICRLPYPFPFSVLKIPLEEFPCFDQIIAANFSREEAKKFSKLGEEETNQLMVMLREEGVPQSQQGFGRVGGRNIVPVSISVPQPSTPKAFTQMHRLAT